MMKKLLLLIGIVVSCRAAHATPLQLIHESTGTPNSAPTQNAQVKLSTGNFNVLNSTTATNINETVTNLTPTNVLGTVANKSTTTYSGASTFSGGTTLNGLVTASTTTTYTAARNDTPGAGPWRLGSTSLFSWRDDTSNNLNLDSFSGSFWVSSFSYTTAGVATYSGQLIGHGTNAADSAAVGFIGEYISSATPSTNGFGIQVSGTYIDVVQITLTAGDWDVSYVDCVILGTATITDVITGVGTVSGNSGTGLNFGDSALDGAPPTAAYDICQSAPNIRKSASSTTTYYLKGRVTISAGTAKFYGRLSARRIR